MAYRAAREYPAIIIIFVMNAEENCLLQRGTPNEKDSAGRAGIMAFVSGEKCGFIYSNDKLTHKKLVELGKDWLKAKGCNPVFAEKGSGQSSEIPDVIGWDCHNCYVIECKMSLADYRVDWKKDHRHKDGLGNLRYYLVPAELKEQIPNDTGWGLITANYNEYGYYSRQVSGRKSKEFERTPYNEVNYLRLRVLDVQRYGT